METNGLADVLVSLVESLPEKDQKEIYKEVEKLRRRRLKKEAKKRETNKG